MLKWVKCSFSRGTVPGRLCFTCFSFSLLSFCVTKERRLNTQHWRKPEPELSLPFLLSVNRMASYTYLIKKNDCVKLRYKNTGKTLHTGTNNFRFSYIFISGLISHSESHYKICWHTYPSTIYVVLQTQKLYY